MSQAMKERFILLFYNKKITFVAKFIEQDMDDYHQQY